MNTVHDINVNFLEQASGYKIDAVLQQKNWKEIWFCPLI